MKNVVDVLPNRSEECLYCYKSLFGKPMCKLTKTRCELVVNEKGEGECNKLMPLDDTMREALKAYTKALSKADKRK